MEAERQAEIRCLNSKLENVVETLQTALVQNQAIPYDEKNHRQEMVRLRTYYDAELRSMGTGIPEMEEKVGHTEKALLRVQKELEEWKAKFEMQKAIL